MRYIIAIRRDARQNAPDNLAVRIRDIPGVHICGDASNERIEVEASTEAIQLVVSRVGSFAHIEPAASHDPEQNEKQRE